MQDITTADSIRALLHSIGFRPGESRDFARSLVTKKKGASGRIHQFLATLLDGPLLTHVKNAVEQLLNCKNPTVSYVWDLLASIWENVKYNMAVASHRLQAALRDIAAEPILIRRRARVLSMRNFELAASLMSWILTHFAILVWRKQSC